MILLNPGPVTLSSRVRAAMAGEDLCHREPEFAALTLDIRRRLEQVYPDAARDYAAVLLTGSGSAAVEAMLSTFADRQAPTLIACNGVYGERMAQMLERQGKPFLALEQPWEDGLDLAAIVRALDSQPQVGAVAVVHHETTTGRLNDLDGLAEVCRARGIGLLIDAVSSFGAEEIAFTRWQPRAVAATANKCLHGIPGVAFVLARHQDLAQSAGRATTLYLDLERYYVAQKDGWSPFTQTVQGFMALHEALCEFEEQGGWAARRAMFAARSDRVAEVLAGRGVAALLPPGASASMLRAYRLPDGVSYAPVHDLLKQRGFTIYAGQGRLSAGIFRIATMGSITSADMARLLSTLEAAWP